MWNVGGDWGKRGRGKGEGGRGDHEGRPYNIGRMHFFGKGRMRFALTEGKGNHKGLHLQRERGDHKGRPYNIGHWAGCRGVGNTLKMGKCNCH